jgi:hypothetical protein
MRRELPEDERDDELTEELAAQSPTPEKDETHSAEGEPTQVNAADSMPDVPREPAPDVELEMSAADFAREELPREDTAASPADTSPAEPSADVAAGQGDSIGAELPSSPAPAASGESGWSNFVPAPGYADPKTGKPRFLTGTVDQAGFELSEFVYGRRPVFEPEFAEPGDNRPPQPPFDLPPRDDGSPPRSGQQHPAGPASAPVFVDVRVGMSPEAIEQVSNGSIRKAAGFSRGETMVVARKLHELIQEITIREQQRRVVWGR